MVETPPNPGTEFEVPEVEAPGVEAPELSAARRNFADGLTLLRALLTPIIMAVVIVGWATTVRQGDVEMFPHLLGASVLASVLFGVAAVSDAFDDLSGGAATAGLRRYGWFDDIADTILVVGTLSALVYATWQTGALGLGLLAPVVALVVRNVLVGLVRGYELSRLGWPQTAFGTAKNAVLMVATLLLVASPWLTPLLEGLRGAPAGAFSSQDNLVWNAGLFGLWIGAALSVVTGAMLLLRPARALAAA